MTKNLLCIAFGFFTMIAVSQNSIEKKLDSVEDETLATKFIESNKALKGKIITFNKEKHNTRLAKDLFKLKKGGKKVYKNEMDKTHYKVIEKQEIPYYRVSYIFLDGNEKSMEDIDDMRADIISKYNEGYRFKDLAKHYSMDDSAKRGGDLGWFTQGDMFPEFEDQVINGKHSVNDIFSVDVPTQNAYYVVVKTHDTKLIEEIKVLKITEPTY